MNVPQSAWSLDDPFAGHPGPVTAAAVTPDGRQIITAFGEAFIRIYPYKVNSFGLA